MRGATLRQKGQVSFAFEQNLDRAIQAGWQLTNQNRPSVASELSKGTWGGGPLQQLTAG
jgi:hypothetical protein